MSDEYIRFERLVAPFGLDGVDGAYRYPLADCDLVGCLDDLSAVKRWLADYEDIDSTWRKYRLAAELLLNWAWFYQHKAVSSMSATDLDGFLDALANPPRSWLVSSEDQRAPLRKPMEISNISLMRAVISSMVLWMNRHGYAHLRFGVIRQVDNGLQPARRMARGRTPPTEPISLREWHHICQVLDTQCTLEMKAMVELMYFCRLRVSELSRVLWSDVRRPSKAFPAWQIVVRHGGARRIVLASPAAETLEVLMHEMGRAASSDFVAQLLGNRSRATMEYNVGKVFQMAAAVAREAGDRDSERALLSRKIPALTKAYEVHAPSHLRAIRACLGLNIHDSAGVHPTIQNLTTALDGGHLLQLHEGLREVWTLVRPGWPSLASVEPNKVPLA